MAPPLPRRCLSASSTECTQWVLFSWWVQNKTRAMKTKLLLIAAFLPTACTPFVNEEAVNELGRTMHRANAYERAGYSPGDAWRAATYTQPGGTFGPGGGMTPIAGWGWSSSSR